MDEHDLPPAKRVLKRTTFDVTCLPVDIWCTIILWVEEMEDVHAVYRTCSKLRDAVLHFAHVYRRAHRTKIDLSEKLNPRFLGHTYLLPNGRMDGPYELINSYDAGDAMPETTTIIVEFWNGQIHGLFSNTIDNACMQRVVDNCVFRFGTMYTGCYNHVTYKDGIPQKIDTLRGELLFVCDPSTPGKMQVMRSTPGRPTIMTFKRLEKINNMKVPKFYYDQGIVEYMYEFTMAGATFRDRWWRIVSLWNE